MRVGQSEGKVFRVGQGKGQGKSSVRVRVRAGARGWVGKGVH